MNGVDGLSESVKRAIKNVKKGYQTNAQRGRIVDNSWMETDTKKRVFLVQLSGSNRRFFATADVDVNTNVGSLVWFLPNGNKNSAIRGVIVGA